MTDINWREQALCAQVDPEMFYPEKGSSAGDARRVCLMCEVRQECLDYALNNGEDHGVWGGYSERERRRLKRGHVIRPAHICPNGHDKTEVGTYSSGECRKCNHERAATRKRLGPQPHGTRTAYNKGCRCESCSRADQIYQHERHLTRGTGKAS